MDGAPDLSGNRRVFRHTVIVVATLATAYALWRLADLLLLLFACALVALVFFDIARWLVRRANIGWGIALGIAIVAVIGFLVGAFWFFGQSLGGEFAELGRRLPAAWRAFEARLAETPIGAAGLARAAEFMPSGQSIVGLVTTVFAGLGAIVSGLAIVIVGGIYLAAQPGLYRRGLLALIPVNARARARSVGGAVATSLNAWLVGQGLGMAFVGVATAIGLSIVGIPAAPAIGVVAGLCEFVPYLGTIVVGIPAVVLGFAESTETGLWTILVLVVVQQVQGNLVMPILQSRMVDLPPALTIFALVAAGVLLGPLGVVLATPLTVVLIVLVRALYLTPADRGARPLVVAGG